MTRASLAGLAEPNAHLWEARLLGSESCMVTTVKAEASEGKSHRAYPLPPPFGVPKCPIPIILFLSHPPWIFLSPVQCSGRICIASLIGVLATSILAGILMPLVGWNCSSNI